MGKEGGVSALRRGLHHLRWNRLTLPYAPFYQQYPFSGPVSIASADRRGCVDLELGVFYNRVPKAANSTVMVNLAQRKLGRDVASKAAKKIFRTPSSLSRSEMVRFPSLYKFTLVRNPYARALSAYLDKVHRKAERDPSRAPSFRGFLAQLEQGDLYRNLHWAPQTSLLLLPLETYDFIARVENLDSDLRVVLARIEKGEGNHSPRSALGNRTGAGDLLTRYYDETTRAIVERLYAKDFAAFGYDPHEL